MASGVPHAARLRWIEKQPGDRILHCLHALAINPQSVQSFLDR